MILQAAHQSHIDRIGLVKLRKFCCANEMTARAGDAAWLNHYRQKTRDHFESAELYRVFPASANDREWKPTKEKPIHEVNSQQLVLTFRNPATDMLRLGMRELKQQRNRVTLKYQSAAELDEADRKR
jgi:hypothetical protein